jgi:transcriptional regulator with XRE-family HTH domain
MPSEKPNTPNNQEDMLKGKAKSQETSALESSAEEQSSGFSARMAECARRVGSVNALARKAGIAQSTIRPYFDGGEPKRPHLVAIARASGVSVGWLVAGEGSMEPDEEEGGIDSGLRIYAEREMGPDADEEDIQEFARQFTARQDNTIQEPRETVPPVIEEELPIQEPRAITSPSADSELAIQTVQQALEAVVQSMETVGYDPGSRTTAHLIGMLLRKELKPEAVPDLLKVLRDGSQDQDPADPGTT